MPVDTTMPCLESDPRRPAAGGVRMPGACGMLKHEPWKESLPLRDQMAWPVEAVVFGFPFTTTAGFRAREAFCRGEEEGEETLF